MIQPHKPTFKRIVLLLMVFILPAGQAAADVLFSYGFNARGIAMGGAEVAQAQDFGVAYYNPGGGILIKKPVLGVGYITTGNWLKTENAPEAKLLSTQGTTFGAVLPLPMGGFMKDRIALQFAAFSPPDIFSDLDVPYPSIPQYPLLRNSGRQATIAPSMSIRISDAFAFGGGAQLFSNTTGEINAIIDSTGDVQTLTGQEVFTSFAPTAGALFRPGEIWPSMSNWAIGAAFREQFFMKYRIPINSYIGSTPLTLIFNATSLYTPRQWVGGVSYTDKAHDFVAEIDASYNEWHKYPDPNLFVEVSFEIPLININFLQGRRIDPNFHDTFTIRGGVEKKVWKTDYLGLLTQAGYFFDQSPVPAQTGQTNYLDTDRHVGALGLGFQFSRIGPVDLGGEITLQTYGQLQYMVPREYYKDTNVSSDNPGYPKVGFSGWLWATGFDIAFAFDFE